MSMFSASCLRLLDKNVEVNEIVCPYADVWVFLFENEQH